MSENIIRLGNDAKSSSKEIRSLGSFHNRICSVNETNGVGAIHHDGFANGYTLFASTGVESVLTILFTHIYVASHTRLHTGSAAIEIIYVGFHDSDGSPNVISPSRQFRTPPKHKLQVTQVLQAAHFYPGRYIS